MLSGFAVVQDVTYIGGDYFGIARYTTWPLNLFADKKTQTLSREVFQQSINAPIPLTLPTAQSDLLTSYLVRCSELGLSVKLFYLSAQAELLPDRASYLGCDYISSLDLSYIYDDGQFLFSMFPEKLSGIQRRMTSSGLFQSYEDANQYAEIRRQLDCQKLGLEYNSEEFFVETFLVPTQSTSVGTLAPIIPKATL